MQNKRPNKGRPHALILAPTRELAAQIGECIETYATQLRIRHTVIFGGVSQKRQVDQLNRGVHIVVATPGRLLDLMNQGHIHLNEVNCFILDEVDRMLDMGFIRDIRRISDSLPGKRQTGFFSATMSPPIEKLARTLVKDPIRITISPEQPAVERIDQKVYFLSKNDKNDLLVSLLNEDPSIEKVVVFTRMKHAANRLAKKLDSKRISGTAIHGNKSQNARVRALEGFKNGKFRVLVATDVAARGLDVEGITHVINFDLPTESETYIHRIGRTARAGAEGSAISFCSPDESEEWCAIEKHLGKTVSVETDHPFHAEFVRAKKPAPKNRQPRRRSNRGRGRNRQR